MSNQAATLAGLQFRQVKYLSLRWQVLASSPSCALLGLPGDHQRHSFARLRAEHHAQHPSGARHEHLAAYLLERAALSEHIRQAAEAHTGPLMSVLAEVPDPEAPAAAHLDRGQSPQLSGAPTPTPAQARQSQRGGAIDSDLSSKRHLQTTLKS